METVGIKALKTHLSEYVAKARTGKRVVITDHGVEVAELIPISSEREAIRSLAAKGKLKWDGGKPAGLTGVKMRGKALAETVIKERR